MTSPSQLAGASAADMADAGPNAGAGNEIGLGNLAAVQQRAKGQAGRARGGPQNMASVAAALFAGNQANLAAVLRSGQILAGGAHEMGRDWAAASLSGAKEALDAFATVRSVPDLVAAQSNLVRSMMDLAFKQGAHVAASSMRLSHQSLEPIKARVSLAAQAFARAG